MAKLKLLSWNVNGIRAALKKGFHDVLLQEMPDICCVQETKAAPEQVDFDFSPYHSYWSAAEKKGYSGTAILTKREPLDVTEGLGLADHDREGRVLTAEYEKFFLVNVYTPNVKRTLDRLAYRTQKWDIDFLSYLQELEAQKPVVFCGDLNVAHEDIDLANAKANRKNAGFTTEERAGFSRLLDAGFIDTFREFEKSGGHYTWWSQMPGVRERNVGWRIDYFCISQSLRPHLKSACILPHIMGSDHCPIQVEISV